MTWNLIHRTRRGFRYYQHSNSVRIVIANNASGAPEHYRDALWLDYRRPLVLDAAAQRIHVPVRVPVTEECTQTSEPSHAAAFLCELWRDNGGEIIAQLGDVAPAFVRELAAHLPEIEVPAKRVLRCDACGEPIANDPLGFAMYATDDEVCAGGDGPGFFLCVSEECNAYHGLDVEARRALYTTQRERNEDMP